jgi:RND family efflux transporter MFP subunit
MNTKTIRNIAIAIVAVGLVSWKLIDNKETMDRQAELSLEVNTIVPVTVCQTQYMNFDQSFNINGRIHAGNEVTIYSKGYGIVLKKYHKKGDAVRKGSIIAELENSVIKENLRIAELDFSKAQKDVARFQKMAEAGAVTRRELEEVQIALRNTESRIAELKDQLANTTLVAPVAGIIEQDYFEEGTLLSVGSQAADMINDTRLKMKVNVTEKEMLVLKRGQHAVITTDVYPGEIFSGTVDVIGSKSDEMLSYPVELLLTDVQAKKLKAGMYATAQFNPQQSGIKMLVVSRKAIVGGIKNPSVFVVKDRKATKVSVKTGNISTDFVEITEGLTSGETVVTGGQINLREGTEVTVLNQ